ncbi:dihydrolipoamide acetyltransferase family protein [Capillimicrobium parvum]|uniref:Dihydrolipoamide acetyltransferase component of pyruvate dehydrogenase complex n=1 Tax=Capillimicrobium parvum TaxID=2884022 RepID=A0A9E6Y041_9ACTN|nr:dihydrolipoamide acetyltransferase family protein [Capillimicrobium parvum]UGS37338.1 Dihydrolipoyllysine-residue acetyltransferase component of pyruvate dehydrogenase complex [Capillimicrobium parvum]
MHDITMPRLSDSMETGTILKWLIEDGRPVAAGEDLVEIETDKATMTHQAEDEGVLEIVAPEGSELAVGEVIARVGAPVSRVGDGGEDAPPTSPPRREAAARAVAAPQPAAPVSPVSGNGTATAVRATPLARRAAAVHEIALDALRGSGPGGRITRADVLTAAGVEVTPLRQAAAAPAAAAGLEAPPVRQAVAAPPRDPARGDVEVHEPTRVQQLIARRMVESASTVPHFQVQTEVVMDAAVALRAQLKTQAAGDGVVPSLNDFVVKACALALRDHPRANGSYRDGAFELHARVNVGVAVAADDALIVPTVFDADRKSLGQIARDVRELAGRVRSGAIRPDELGGGTFTVSNLGMFGMTAITPVINVPQAGILGVGALREVLARVDGEIADRTLMTLTLSCDHRILYGADAARLLADIRDLLETPLRLAL